MGHSQSDESEIIHYIEPSESSSVSRPRKRAEVQKLPEELLLYIFEFIAGDDHNVMDNVSFMMVCRLWDALVRNTRALWSTISIALDCYSDISSLCDQARACIRYSENAMLDIRVQIDSMLDTDLEDDEDDPLEITTLEIEPIFRGYLNLIGVLLGEFGCNAWRWQSVSLWLASGLDDKISLYILRSLAYQMPNLRNLSIHLGYAPNTEISWDAVQLLDILPGLTSLRSLSVDHRFILRIHSFVPSLIVELTLMDSPSVREFFSIGSQFTALQRLSVDLRDRNVISGRDVFLPALTYLKASGWSPLELISHLMAEKLAYLDIADADFTASHLVGSIAYGSITTLSWRSRDPTMMTGRTCNYITLLAFMLVQCSLLVEIRLWKKHRDVFEQAVTKARREGPVLKALRRLKIYGSCWEFNDQNLAEVINMSIPGD